MWKAWHTAADGSCGDHAVSEGEAGAAEGVQGPKTADRRPGHVLSGSAGEVQDLVFLTHGNEAYVNESKVGVAADEWAVLLRLTVHFGAWMTWAARRVGTISFSLVHCPWKSPVDWMYR